MSRVGPIQDIVDYREVPVFSGAGTVVGYPGDATILRKKWYVLLFVTRDFL